MKGKREKESSIISERLRESFFLASATGAVQWCCERLPSTGAEKVLVLKVWYKWELCCILHGVSNLCHSCVCVCCVLYDILHADKLKLGRLLSVVTFCF